VPAHFDEEQKKYISTAPSPLILNAKAKRWFLKMVHVSWDDVMKKRLEKLVVR